MPPTLTDPHGSALRAAIREWANAEKRNGPESVDLRDIVELLVATDMRSGTMGPALSDILLTARPPARATRR